MEYAMTLRHEFNAGKEQATLKAIKSLMNNPELHCTPERAMDILKVPQEDRSKYLKSLKEEKLI